MPVLAARRKRRLECDSRRRATANVVWPYRPRIEGLFSASSAGPASATATRIGDRSPATMSRPSTARPRRAASPTPRRPETLHLAHQREPRRQRQRDLLRICRGRPPLTSMCCKTTSAIGPTPAAPRNLYLKRVKYGNALPTLGAAGPYRNILVVRGCARLRRGPRNSPSRRCRSGANSVQRSLAASSLGRHGRTRSRAIAPALTSAPIGCAGRC